MQKKFLKQKILIVASLLLLLFNIFHFYFYDLKYSNFWSIIGNLFITLALVKSLKNLKKEQNEKKH